LYAVGPADHETSFFGMNIATATQAILPPLVAACTRNRWRVLLIAAVLAAGSLWATQTFLGVTTDTGGMFAA
jgi:peptidoglycan/LPS O-acetylase OafA/YrhL